MPPTDGFPPALQARAEEYRQALSEVSAVAADLEEAEKAMAEQDAKLGSVDMSGDMVQLKEQKERELQSAKTLQAESEQHLEHKRAERAKLQAEVAALQQGLASVQGWSGRWEFALSCALPATD